MGRFYREHVREQELRAEFEDWKGRFEGRPDPGPECQWVRDDPHIMPSLVRLKSFTLDAPLDEIEQLAVYQGERMPFGHWRLYPDSGVFASAISLIRLSHPRHYDRLIPKSGPPGPWVLGLERSIQSKWSMLLQQMETWDGNKKPAWPVVGWIEWQTPASHATSGPGPLRVRGRHAGPGTTSAHVQRVDPNQLEHLRAVVRRLTSAWIS